MIQNQKKINRKAAKQQSRKKSLLIRRVTLIKEGNQTIFLNRY